MQQDQQENQKIMSEVHSNLVLGNQKWEKNKEHYLMSKEWRLKVISFRQTQNKILKEISQVQFVNLNEITFRQNHIQSVEVLSRMWMPQLQYIRLSANQIMTLSNLYKANWPKIFLIAVYSNNIPCADSLTKLHAYRLNWFYPGNDLENTGQFVDVRFVMKIQTKQLRDFDLRDKYLIINKNFIKSLRRKYPPITLYPQSLAE